MSDYPTIEQCIGNTPLVRLQRLPGATSNTLLAKLEGNNPAGSVKDRPALSMIAEAEARGDIRPGDTLIEATSGNTGIALAIFTGFIIYGGIHRIAKAADVIIPIMALSYIAMALIVIVLNITSLPAVIWDIVANALGFREAVAGGMGAAAKDLDFRQGHADIPALRQMLPEGQFFGSGAGLEDSHGSGDDCISAKSAAIGGAVKPDHCLVDFFLIVRIKSDQPRAYLFIDGGNCAPDIKPAKCFPAVAEINGFAAAHGGTGGRNGPPTCAAAQLNIDFDCRSATGIPDPASVNRFNRCINHLLNSLPMRCEYRPVALAVP